MNNPLLLIVGIAVLAFSPLTLAGESVFIARVDTVLALPNNHERCFGLCPPDLTCITNSCGCAEAVLTQLEQLLGTAPTSPVVISERIGEWCVLPTPPDTELLVRQIDQAVTWGRLLPGLNGAEFEADDFSVIGEIDISSLPADEGRVQLSELRRRLGE